MSKPKRQIQLSDDAIRAIYGQGEDAVVSWVRQLLVVHQRRMGFVRPNKNQPLFSC